MENHYDSLRLCEKIRAIQLILQNFCFVKVKSQVDVSQKTRILVFSSPESTDIYPTCSYYVHFVFSTSQLQSSTSVSIHCEWALGRVYGDINFKQIRLPRSTNNWFKGKVYFNRLPLISLGQFVVIHFPIIQHLLWIFLQLPNIRMLRILNIRKS